MNSNPYFKVLQAVLYRRHGGFSGMPRSGAALAVRVSDATTCPLTCAIPGNDLSCRRWLTPPPPLSTTIPPISEQGERRLISTILAEVHENFGVKINISPSLERGMVTPVNQSSGGRVILISALHMGRTAEYMQELKKHLKNWIWLAMTRLSWSWFPTSLTWEPMMMGRQPPPLGRAMAATTSIDP